jgi:hypothetical protein
MNTRKIIKNSHEYYVVNQFISWYNKRHRTRYTIVAKPDPPDAIVRSKRRTQWIEHCDIYRHGDEAREEYSAIIPGERFVSHSEHPIFEPDDRTASALLTSIASKISKTSYEDHVKKYGKGILIANERDPLFSSSTIHTIKKRILGAQIDIEASHFKSVYLGFRVKNGLQFIKLLPMRSRT